MAYSIGGIANLALNRIGGKPITWGDGSPSDIRVQACWEYIRDEVLEARDWKFAKLRVNLAQNTTSPANTNAWLYAYTLPSDFLRPAKDYKNLYKDDPAVYPSGYPYVIEALADGTKCLFTDYDNSSADLFLTYIRKIIDPQKYSGNFISALAWRLGAEVSIPMTEGKDKFAWCMGHYDKTLIRADEINQLSDYIENELGSEDWLNAR